MPPTLTWTASVDCRELVAAGHEVIEFTTLPREIVAPARSLDGRPKSIDNPAQDWLDLSRGRIGWVVLDVRIRDLDELAALHGCVLEPALRSGTELLIERRAPTGLRRRPFWLRAETSAVVDGIADRPSGGQHVSVDRGPADARKGLTIKHPDDGV